VLPLSGAQSNPHPLVSWSHSYCVLLVGDGADSRIWATFKRVPFKENNVKLSLCLIKHHYVQTD